MRQIDDGLRDLFELLIVDRIDQQREKNGHRKAKYDAVKGKTQRIDDDAFKLIRIEKFDEIFEAYPFAAPDAAGYGILFKRDLNSQHGHIGKNNDVHHRDEQECIQTPVPLEAF